MDKKEWVFEIGQKLTNKAAALRCIVVAHIWDGTSALYALEWMTPQPEFCNSKWYFARDIEYYYSANVDSKDGIGAWKAT